MEPSTRSSKNKQTKHRCIPVPCNPFPSAVAVAISDYWYYYPEDGWGKWSSPARLPQFYEMKVWLADSLGRKKGHQKTKQNKTTEKAVGESHQMLPSHISANTAEWLQDICLLLGLSSHPFIFYFFGGSIHRELKIASLWNFLNKMFTLPDQLLFSLWWQNTFKSSLRTIYLGSQLEGTAHCSREDIDSYKSLRQLATVHLQAGSREWWTLVLSSPSIFSPVTCRRPQAMGWCHLHWGYIFPSCANTLKVLSILHLEMCLLGDSKASEVLEWITSLPMLSPFQSRTQQQLYSS